MDVGSKIKSLRKAMGLNQTQLGEKVGVKKNAVSKWECGRVEGIPRSTIKALADLFNVPTSYLIDDDAPEYPALPKNIIPMPEMKKVPLLGSIACGQPILAEEHIEDYIDIPKHITADFALTCKGDSMINARIFDGDTVYIRHQDTVENGEIAAVLVGDDEATLKRIHVYEDHIVLSPENPMYKPMSYWDENMNQVKILGKAIAFTSPIH